MKPDWNERYSTDQYVYGKEPNEYFSSELGKLSPGRILLPGEGEGRNAVHAALAGWQVDAFDQSSVAREKALALASENGVSLQYRVGPLETYPFHPRSYDAVALIYFHVEQAGRKHLHRKAVEALRPGGRLILEAFHKDQLNLDSGGPRSLDLLFDEGLIRSDFAGLEDLLVERKEILLDEGRLHSGKASVLRMTGVKPK